MKDNQNGIRPSLLVVEDDPDIQEQFKWALASDYAVLEARDRATALATVQRQAPRLVLLDLGLPPDTDTAAEGLQALREILQHDPGAKVIVVTGNAERSVAHEALQRGAWDYISKPADLQALRVILGRARHMTTLEEEWRQSQKVPAEGVFCGMIGESLPMQRVYEAIRRVASTSISVLITGESGTGKEVVARAIHTLSPNASQPFVPIHCAAIPEGLLESELFGHERGSFTGADRLQKGRLEAAEGGTVLLDEVGEITPAAQVKLLRFLQDRRLERVGGREQITMNVRILAATNSDLRASIAAGRFREDLFYRLSVVEIMVPPLRERGQDVLLLVKAFVMQYRDELGRRVKGLSEAALKAIRSHKWPGNVRELENRVKRAILMAQGPTIGPDDLELPWEEPGQPAMKLKRMKAEVEKDMIQRALLSQNWNITRAAQELDISRQTLYSMMKKYGLEKPQ